MPLSNFIRFACDTAVKSLDAKRNPFLRLERPTGQIEEAAAEGAKETFSRIVPKAAEVWTEVSPGKVEHIKRCERGICRHPKQCIVPGECFAMKPFA